MPDSVPLALMPAQRQTLGEQIAGSLREAIFGGLFRPGQRLPEAQIAGRLKVSRAPVREALASLEQEGLVRRSANRGTTVVDLTRRDVEELCSLRLPLEVLAVRLVIVRGDGEHLDRLEANVRETAGVCTPERLAALDLEFHETLVRAAGHARLLAAWLALRSQIHLLMIHRNRGDADSPRGTVQGHHELLEAIRARDEARAVALVETHHQRQYAWLIKGFEASERAG
jgi:DNA-binding GntR family transcriptional regulator